MVAPAVTIVIPTLNAGPVLDECLAGLARQTRGDFEIVIVDNSGSGRVRREHNVEERATVIENAENLGFGAAVNQGFRATAAPYLAVLNDDAVPDPQWITKLVAGMETDERIGMCASRVLLAPSGLIDGAGMLMAPDGSSKQRGHGEKADRYAQTEEVLFPSGSAALYRRSMLDEIGMFEESYFLYCEDTDLGLRGRWAGWRCLYVADAVVYHKYSQSAGQASPLKAWYVERNRLYTAVRNLPARALLAVPFATVARYFWHLWFLLQGRGKAAEYVQGASALTLVWFVLKAQLAVAFRLGWLLRERRRIRGTARVPAREFLRLLDQHRISVREVAAL